MRIINKRMLSDTGSTRVFRIEVEAPRVAEKGRPGQFVILMVSGEGERIPLTIVERDKAKGAITLIYQELGLTTRLLSEKEVGDDLYALLGPLGHATEIKNYGTVVLIGGGVGIAEIYPVAEVLKEAGNRVISIIGSRTAALMMLEDEMRSVSDELFVTTDDGSLGRKGFTTDILKELLEAQGPGDKIDLVYAVGPIPMMRNACRVTGPYKTKTLVSLNSLMIDGTGMCGGCRVTVGGETKFTCVDGPEFDGHLVDWGELAKRNNTYIPQEKHICKLRFGR